MPTLWRPADGRVGWPGPPPRTGLLPLALLAALPYILSRLAGH